MQMIVLCAISFQLVIASIICAVYRQGAYRVYAFGGGKGRWHQQMARLWMGVLCQAAADPMRSLPRRARRAVRCAQAQGCSGGRRWQRICA